MRIDSKANQWEKTQRIMNCETRSRCIRIVFAGNYKFLSEEFYLISCGHKLYHVY